MRYLTADIGSTFTKLTAIDTEKQQVLATSASFTTISTDVTEGFFNALEILESKTGKFHYDKLLCCSSAAGGLKMVALGLVPSLTAKAAKMAASSAGAKVVKTYSFEISQEEADEIEKISPDLILLCGGTNGGNKDIIESNARKLSTIKGNFSIIVAGNKSAQDNVESILKKSSKEFVITANVMPEFNKLNIEPARERIRELFINKIIEAKGLSSLNNMSSHSIIPTPLAVMEGCKLLGKGTSLQEGIGDFMAVDLGGATTDVYSMATGAPSSDDMIYRGLPEPYAKRSVEGDLGMRYSLNSLVEECGVEWIADECGVDVNEITLWVEKCTKEPAIIAKEGTIQEKIEMAIAKAAVKIATERHCGRIESVFTPMGQMYTINGKDLSQIPLVIGIGGAIINSPNPSEIITGAIKTKSEFCHAKPTNPEKKIDRRYILASMGLLSMDDKESALNIMKNEIFHKI